MNRELIKMRMKVMKRKLMVIGMVIGIVAIIVVTVLTWNFLFSQPLEPVSTSIPFRLELELPDYIFLVGEAHFEFNLEAVESESEMVVPMPETTTLSTADTANAIFDFGKVGFTEPNVFEYRVFQRMLDDGDEENGATEWIVDESIFYITITVEVYDDELVMSKAVVRVYDDHLSEEVAEIVFVNQYELAFLGVWEYGFGNVIRGLSDARRVEILPDGTFNSYNFWDRENTWEMNGDGKFVTADFSPNPIIELGMAVNGDRLIVTDEFGYTRTWWREGTRENQDDLAFLGVWQYGHGYRLEDLSGFNRSHAIEFTAEGALFDTGFEFLGTSWELNEEGRLMVEVRHRSPQHIAFLEIEVEEDRLIIVDEEGNIGIWWRESVDPNDEQDGVIGAYLDYFDIDDGYRIVRNVEIEGDQFDFVVYDLEAIHEIDEQSRRDWYFIVIVKRDGEVFDVLRHDVLSQQVTVNDVVVEVDLNDDGYNDILLFYGYIGGEIDGTRTEAGRRYELFLQQNGRMENIVNFSTVSDPRISVENQWVLSSSRTGYGSVYWRFYIWQDNEVIMLEQLDLIRDQFAVEKSWIAGEWQEQRLCLLQHPEFETCLDEGGVPATESSIFNKLIGEEAYQGWWWYRDHFWVESSDAHD